MHLHLSANIDIFLKDMLARQFFARLVLDFSDDHFAFIYKQGIIIAVNMLIKPSAKEHCSKVFILLIFRTSSLGFRCHV